MAPPKHVPGPEILKVVDEERAQLGRMLHDSVCQSLNALHIFTNLHARRLASGEHPETAEAQALCDRAQKAMTEMREIVDRLTPVALEPFELPAYLDTLCRRMSRRIPCELRYDLEAKLPQATADTFCTIARDGLALLASVESLRHLKMELTGHGRNVALSICGKSVGNEMNLLPAESREWTLLAARAASIGAKMRLDWARKNTLLLSCTLPMLADAE